MTTTALTLPTIAELTGKYTRDVRVMRYNCGVTNPNVAEGSEPFIRGRAIAGMVFQVVARQVAKQDANMVDTAMGDDLRRLCDIYGVIESAGAGATGNTLVKCTGTVTYVQGLEAKGDDGLRYEVVTTTTATNGGRVPLKGKDTGKRTDRIAGAKLVWTAPPTGSAIESYVDESGLSNGVDADTVETLRRKLQDALRHPPTSGAWAHYRKWAEDASAAVQAAFVYPAAQGPATIHVAFMVAATAENYYSREASTALGLEVNRAIVAEHPEHADLTITTVADEEKNLVLRVTAPAARADGGPGGGWVDPVALRWPNYFSAGTNRTSLNAAPTSATVLSMDIVSASNAPTNDKIGAHFAIWSSTKKKFIHARLKSYSLVTATTYTITLYEPIDIAALISGDYVSPDMERLDDYGRLLAEAFAGLGPGEKVSDANLLPRAYRHPFAWEAWPTSFTSKDVGKLSTTYPEITHVSVVYPATMPIAPTIAAGVTYPPKVLTLGNLAIYPSA